MKRQIARGFYTVCKAIHQLLLQLQILAKACGNTKKILNGKIVMLHRALNFKVNTAL